MLVRTGHKSLLGILKELMLPMRFRPTPHTVSQSETLPLRYLGHHRLNEHDFIIYSFTRSGFIYLFPNHSQNIRASDTTLRPNRSKRSIVESQTHKLLCYCPDIDYL